jgi:hypothetical protein
MIRTKLARFWLAVTVLAGAAVVSTPSQALPSFARQTNKACTACHFENFPMLNDYGRAFKASGFTEIYNEPTRENTDGADLSIPMVLNAAFFGTMRYDRYSGSGMSGMDPASNPVAGSSVSEWTVPEEASLFLSGRVGANVGFHSEVGLRPTAALAAFKLPFSFPINDTMRVLAIPFAADGHGPSYGFEVLNTGANDIHLPYDNGAQTSAQGYLGLADAGATGASLVLWDPRFYVGFTKWAPTAGPMGIGSNYSPPDGIKSGKTPSANYFRAVYFIPTPGWDTAVGYQYLGGSAADPSYSTHDANGNPVAFTGTTFDAKMWAIDAQIQGAIGEHQLGVYFTHAAAPYSSNGVAGNQNLFNMNGPNTRSATTIAASYGLIPGKLNASAAYLKADNGTDGSAGPTSDNAFTLSLSYMFAQNVKFMFETTNLQNPGAFDGYVDTNGNTWTGIKQKMSFKLWYDM